MEQLDLNVCLRTTFGKKFSKIMRRDGAIPSVVYGGKRHKSLSVKMVDFEKTIQGHSGLGNLVFFLVFSDKKENRYAVVQEIQRDPLSEKILHIDFREISLKDEIETRVPLALKGIPVGVQSGGLIQQHLYEIHIRCLPEDLPDSYKLDVADLNIGDFLHVFDLSALDNIEIIQNPKDMVLAIVSSKVFEKEEGDTEEEAKQPEVIGQKKEKDID